MLPTIDFWGFLKKTLGLLIRKSANPIVLLLVSVTALSVCASTLYNGFADKLIPIIEVKDLNFDYSNENLTGFLLYILNVDAALEVIFFYVDFLNYLIPFTVTFFVSCYGVMFLLRVNSAFRQSLQDLFN